MLEKFREKIRKVEDLKKRVEGSMTDLHHESISAAAILERPDQILVQPQDVTVQQLTPVNSTAH